MRHPEGTPPGVLVRDLLLFQFKLTLDGMKDAVVIPLSVLAVVLDLLIGGRERGRIFYKLMNGCERFDLWLNLYGSARGARGNRDGLFGESRAGSGTFLGEMEERIRGGDGPVRPTGSSHPRPPLPEPGE